MCLKEPSLMLNSSLHPIATLITRWLVYLAAVQHANVVFRVKNRLQYGAPCISHS